MTPAREEHLLGLAKELVTELETVAIHVLDDETRTTVEIGVPRSCLGTVTSFLAHERDTGRLRGFVRQLHQVDGMVHQNKGLPRAQHTALQSVLATWLEEQAELTANEYLYVLSWARRLLPTKSKKASPGPKKASSLPEASTSHRDEQPAIRGGQMAAAFKRVRDFKKSG